MYTYVYTCVWTHTCMLMSEGDLQWLNLSFNHVDPKDQTQVVWKELYHLRHHIEPTHPLFPLRGWLATVGLNVDFLWGRDENPGGLRCMMWKSQIINMLDFIKSFFYI